MRNKEIIYERDINKSYMKILSGAEECFDERILSRRYFEGTVPMERCFVNGSGQYWYNISGKQALDNYCRLNAIGQTFFEKIILCVCNQLEVLEWNLVDSRCLVVDPEYIFVDNNGEDVSFVLFPREKGDFFGEFQELMEYLLTKLNHSDKDAVHAAYQIYELTLNDGCSIGSIKDAILQRRIKEKKVQILQDAQIHPEEFEVTDRSQETCVTEKAKWSLFFIPQEIEEKISVLFEKLAKVLKKENKEQVPLVVYPEDSETMEEIEIHPTVCLSVPLGEPQGMLMYEGMGDYPDFEIKQMLCLIGKSHKASLQIERETISQIHAKIDFLAGDYYIEDMNSTNGTYLNDEILNYKEKRKMSPGDVIRFADVKYRFL